MTGTEILPLEPLVTPSTTPTVTVPGGEQSSRGADVTGSDTDRATIGVPKVAGSVQITTVEPTATSEPVTSEPVTPTKSLTGTITPEVTGTPETPTPTPTVAATPTPAQAPTVYLEKADGLRLVARQTVIIAQISLSGQHRLVAVLGNDNAGIQNGVERLMTGDYTGCLTGADLVVCSFEGGPEGEVAPSLPAATTQPNASLTPSVTPLTPPEAAPSGTPSSPESPEANNSILIVDDNDMANPNDPSEADTYLIALTQAGYTPDLWVTADQNAPPVDKVLSYRWVIWSSGGYENGGPGVSDLDVLLNYINHGGWLTISSRRPFFAMSTEDASVIADITVGNDSPELVEGLPQGTITLANGLPPVTPLDIHDGLEGPLVALRRGPNSGNPDAPLLFMATDAGSPDATGARLMILGMSLNWMPEGLDVQLAQNMAKVMLAGE
jgi:hypothetical protein